jgi:Tol biopolymer transport system component
MAVAFDTDRLETRGDAKQVAASGGTSFAVSNEGTLIYAVRDSVAPRTLVWVDRRGREEDLGAPPGNYVYPRLSPDGLRVAVDIYSGNRDIYIWNIASKVLEPFTLDPAEDLYAQWNREGTQLVWESARYGVPNLYSPGCRSQRQPPAPDRE